VLDDELPEELLDDELPPPQPARRAIPVTAARPKEINFLAFILKTVLSLELSNLLFF
jgi:hypothetical protein